MGGLQQTTLRRSRGRAGLSVALYPPRRHLQQPPAGCDNDGVAFKYKDYRAKGRARQKVMRLAKDEFIRRFLIHVLPTGFHRIRHYGLFASGVRVHNVARARELLAAATPPQRDERPEPRILAHPCPCCGGRMIVIETFERGRASRGSSLGEIRIDTS